MYFCVRTDFVFFWEFVVWSLVCRVNRKHIKVCFSPYVIRCTWLGSKYELTNWLQAVWLLGYRVFTGSMTAWLLGFYRQYDCLVTGFLQAVRLFGYRVFTGSTTAWLQDFYRQYDRLVTGFLLTVWWVCYRVRTRSGAGRSGGQGNKSIPQPAAHATAGYHQRGRHQQQDPLLFHPPTRQHCAERTTGRSKQYYP